MRTIRGWSTDPDPIPLDELNFELAEQIIYHVDADRKLTGATLKMSSGNQIEVTASAAVSIFRAIGNSDYEARRFLGKPKWVLWLFILMLLVLLWIIFEPLIK